jgi:AbrB family looped-hinge helix DNA binding protein
MCTIRKPRRRCAVKVTVSSKGQIVLPAEIRKKYGVEQGTQLELLDNGVSISLIPDRKAAVHALRGILRDAGYSTADFVQERREEAVREVARRGGTST